ncbi:MAG TPA: preprotein translocase subunit YajC [Sedimentisphaerales bacterium]|nr:preprotein translocase subunit YajC [Sedimentisphaerales bacterium]
MDYTWILAQADSGQAPSRIGSEPVQTSGEATTSAPGSPAGGPAAAETQKPSSSGLTQLVLFVAVMGVLMYVMMFRGPKKQQQQHKLMLQSLKKNDKVRTIGGIFGTVVDVRDDEIVLKVDESNNTKIRISSSAISKNLSQGAKE